MGRLKAVGWDGTLSGGPLQDQFSEMEWKQFNAESFQHSKPPFLEVFGP